MTAVQQFEVLPGLEIPQQNNRFGVTPMETIARKHIALLREAQLLSPFDDLLCELVVDLARTVGMGAVSGKAAGVALASRQLLDAMDALPKPMSADQKSALDDLIDELREGVD